MINGIFGKWYKVWKKIYTKLQSENTGVNKVDSHLTYSCITDLQPADILFDIF